MRISKNSLERTGILVFLLGYRCIDGSKDFQSAEESPNIKRPTASMKLIALSHDDLAVFLTYIYYMMRKVS